MSRSFQLFHVGHEKHLPVFETAREKDSWYSQLNVLVEEKVAETALKFKQSEAFTISLLTS